MTNQRFITSIVATATAPTPMMPWHRDLRAQKVAAKTAAKIVAFPKVCTPRKLAA